MCGWIISLYCVAFGLSQKCFPRSKKGLRLRGLGWDFHFLETPSVLFCMVPPGTTALIFLEGMFREPPSPRGKDNGGCDVTSILGASGGKEKSWVALMSSGTPFLEEFHNIREGGFKMVPPVQPNIWTPTPVHVGATHSLPSGAVNSLLDERKKTGFHLMFPCRVSRQAEEHFHQWGLKWLLVKCKGSSPRQNITWLTTLLVWGCCLLIRLA